MSDITRNVVTCIESVICALVDNPQDIDVNAKTGERMITVDISANKEDIGKIIGKKGKTISSLRNLMQSIVANHKKRINIVVLD